MKIGYWLGHTFFKNLALGLFDYRVHGREKLNRPGPALLVCNHASFVDPPLVGVAFDEEIHYLARKTLMSNPVAKLVYKTWNSIPVDQEKPDMSSLKAVIRLLKQGKKVLIFPEGARTPDGNMLPGLPGVGLIIAKAQAPVIPLRLFGTREAMPYGSSLMHPSEISLVVGDEWHYDPAKYQESGKELYQRISDEMMSEISALSL